MSKAMTLAVACVLATPLIGHAQQNRMANRFAAMDRNGDGVITRQEWNGSDQSFRAQDWNGDGVLAGAEVRQGARRPRSAGNDPTYDSANRNDEFDDWTAQGFSDLDRNGDGRLTSDEWHFNREGFYRADHNGDGVVTRAEFLGEDSLPDNRVDDRVANMDANHDGRVTRDEWRGSRAAFDRLDGNRDGVLSGTEVSGNEPPPDFFTSVDTNRDGQITRDEWQWSRSSFDMRDRNRDGRLSRDEFVPGVDSHSRAWQAGFERGRSEGLLAGREDRERNQGWDLDGQRELETADSGYTPALGSKAEYQAGYREGFRPAYREGYGR
jgi:Ca2+-binding EF-hand superfamily protein